MANLVPCYQKGMNTAPGSMRTYELIIGRALAGLPAGAAVYYAVTPLYKNSTSTIPAGAEMSATVQMPDGSSWPVIDPLAVANTPSGGGPNLGN